MNFCKDCLHKKIHEREFWCGRPEFYGFDYVTGERLIKKCAEAREWDEYVSLVTDCKYFKPLPSPTYTAIDNREDKTGVPGFEYARKGK